MEKKIIRWLMNIVFFIIYFLIYDYIIGRRLPISLVADLFSIIVIIVINIPLSVFSTQKVFSIIEEK